MHPFYAQVCNIIIMAIKKKRFVSETFSQKKLSAVRFFKIFFLYRKLAMRYAIFVYVLLIYLIHKHSTSSSRTINIFKYRTMERRGTFLFIFNLYCQHVELRAKISYSNARGFLRQTFSFLWPF